MHGSTADPSHYAPVRRHEEADDPRADNARHLLTDILVIAILGVMGGLDDYPGIVQYARDEQEWLKTFLRLPHGILSVSTFRRVFAALKPSVLLNVMQCWSGNLSGSMKGKQIAVDGKTLRRSFEHAWDKSVKLGRATNASRPTATATISSASYYRRPRSNDFALSAPSCTSSEIDAADALPIEWYVGGVLRFSMSSSLSPAAFRREFRPAVVAPTFNNARTLSAVLQRLDVLQLPIVVVNDGSTDETAAILHKWSRGRHDRQVCSHRRNQGKAAALHSGFAICRAADFTHAVSIDTDDQLSPEDVPRLLLAAREKPTALVLGTRDEHCADYPFRSRLGRRLSNGLIRMECGQRVDDSQCGLRVYPLDTIAEEGCRAGHYGFETEVITRAAWNGLPILSVPVDCRYLPCGQRVSHFKPLKDSLRAASMHARLLGRSLAPRRATGSSQPRRSFVQRWRSQVHQFALCLNPLAAWRTLKQDQVGRTDFAVGFALGVFIANLPLYGVQTIVAMFSARRLHLNPLSVLAGTQVSMPPIGPALIAAAIIVGHLLTHGTMLTPAAIHAQMHGHVAGFIGATLLDWVVGSVCVGSVLAVLSFVLVRLLLKIAFGRQSRRTGGLRTHGRLRPVRRSSRRGPQRASQRAAWQDAPAYAVPPQAVVSGAE